MSTAGTAGHDYGGYLTAGNRKTDRYYLTATNGLTADKTRTTAHTTMRWISYHEQSFPNLASNVAEINQGGWRGLSQVWNPGRCGK